MVGNAAASLSLSPDTEHKSKGAYGQLVLGSQMGPSISHSSAHPEEMRRGPSDLLGQNSCNALTLRAVVDLSQAQSALCKPERVLKSQDFLFCSLTPSKVSVNTTKLYT